MLIATFAIAGGIGMSLYWTQIVDGSMYAAKAEKQYEKPPMQLFDRGTIFFESKDGTRAAAASIENGYILYINPTIIGDPEEAYKALIQYLDIDKGEFLRKATKVDDPYEEISSKVDEKSADSITNLSIKGVGLIKQTWRTYPGGGLAAQSIGITGQNEEGMVVGRYGLERTYEKILARSGTAGDGNIFAELFSEIRNSVKEVPNHEGSVVTTIEPTVQKYLEQILGNVSDTWNPDEVGGIIIDPNTGEIAALASFPSFDPNDVSNISNPIIFSNPLVENAYEMGSIVKPLTIAVGLDTKSITTNFTYDDTGTIVLNGKKISNFDGRARGIIPVQEILSQSLNVGAATVALKVGKDQFATYFKELGFGKQTGIDQPSETNGLITNLESGRDIEIATAAYGQGVAVSPVSMTRSLSTLANGGYLVTPRLAKQLEYSDGTIKKIAVEKSGPIFSKDTTEAVARMLVKAYDTALHKGDLQMEHYSVAAKTGTAQIPDTEKRGYYQDRYLHSFFGYFPAYNPKYLVFLYQIHPKGAQYASETLALPFSEIAKFLIDYYNVPPDR